MTRKFKTVGVLMAVVAMFAMTASAAQAQFTSEKYPATLTGSSTKDVFDAFGSTVSCTNNTFSGSLAAGSNTLSITPSYSNCTAFGLPATVNMTGCEFRLDEISRHLDVICPGTGIDITVYGSMSHITPLCHVYIPAQTGKTGWNLTQSGNNVILSGSVGSITATQTRNSIFCPAGTHTAASTYTIQAGGITVSGNNGKVFFD